MGRAGATLSYRPVVKPRVVCELSADSTCEGSKANQRPARKQRLKSTRDWAACGRARQTVQSAAPVAAAFSNTTHKFTKAVSGSRWSCQGCHSSWSPGAGKRPRTSAAHSSGRGNRSKAAGSRGTLREDLCEKRSAIPAGPGKDSATTCIPDVILAKPPGPAAARAAAFAASRQLVTKPGLRPAALCWKRWSTAGD